MNMGSNSQSTPSEGPREPKREEKRVSFHPEAKTYDGLHHATDMFNEYMQDVLSQAKQKFSQTTVGILAKNLNILGLATLQKMLTDLIWRCDRSRRGRAVILNKGGGYRGIITRQHIPYLISHVEYLERVIGSVRTAIRRREARAAQNAS